MDISYPLTVLPVIGYNIDKTLNNILFSFLWDSKPDKIKRKAICSDLKQGGIRYPNISYYLKSTKISWWKIVFNSEDLRHIVTYFFPPLQYLDKDILDCNMCKDDLIYYTHKATHSIVYEMLYYLYDIKYVKWNDKTNYKDEIIWLNSCIRVNKPILNIKCVQCGVLNISDLMIDGIVLMTFDEFVEKYGNIINFMDYNSIMSAINAGIREAQIYTVPELCKPLDVNMLINCKKPQRFAYDYICNRDTDHVLIKLSEKWSNVLNINIDAKYISNCFMSIPKTTIYVRHRNFMYKYFHMKLFLNPVLFAMGIKDTDKCSFCDIHTETMYHLFYQCKYTIELWAHVKTFCYN